MPLPMHTRRMRSGVRMSNKWCRGPHRHQDPSCHLLQACILLSRHCRFPQVCMHRPACSLDSHISSRTSSIRPCIVCRQAGNRSTIGSNVSILSSTSQRPRLRRTIIHRHTQIAGPPIRPSSPNLAMRTNRSLHSPADICCPPSRPPLRTPRQLLISSRRISSSNMRLGLNRPLNMHDPHIINLHMLRLPQLHVQLLRPSQLGACLQTSSPNSLRRLEVGGSLCGRAKRSRCHPCSVQRHPLTRDSNLTARQSHALRLSQSRHLLHNQLILKIEMSRRDRRSVANVAEGRALAMCVKAVSPRRLSTAPCGLLGVSP